MKIQFVLFVILWASISDVNGEEQCGRSSYLSGTIIGGKSALPGQLPWIVPLQLKNEEKFLCGASIISRRHLLTGEFSKLHCVFIK